jgi:hypothetical protein
VRFKYTAEQLDFLRDGYQRMDVSELTEAFNRQFGTSKSRVAIKSALSGNGFTCGRPTGGKKGTLRIWTKEQADFITEAYSRMPLDRVLVELNQRFSSSFTFTQLRAFTRNHGVLSGRTGRFHKGQPRTPGSGAKGPNRTSFKKGCMSGAAQHNYVPIGSFRVSKDGYLERKVTDDPSLAPARRWVGVHRLNWEAAHGPIPDGHCVCFIDGDPLNAELDNLVLLSRRELVWLNKTRLGAVPAELRPAAIATAKVVVRAKELESRA